MPSFVELRGLPAGGAAKRTWAGRRRSDEVLLRKMGGKVVLNPPLWAGKRMAAEESRMRIALIGSRWFGAQMFRLLAEKSHDLSVIGLEEEDQLTTAARAAGVPLIVLGRARRVVVADIPDAVDV